ncbi:MAG: hypothetical protein HRU09_08775 [Oligoflexales bacterium]|nr:hypothetical protein [Oligoflexales bacterium]
MSAKKDEFLENFNRFGKRSIQWSIDESENEIKNITDTLRAVMDDVDRRSKMSKETFELLGNVKERMKEVFEQRQVSISQVVQELTDLGSDHREMSELACPLIYALQFQDRMRQILENSSKIAEYWLKKRKAFAKEPFSQEKLLEVGEDLLSLTTCQEERKIIRKYIKCLPEEKLPTESTIVF